jgi:3-oxoadipate enol-lactonase
MPTIQSNGCPINVVIEGAENAPVLMLSNSLGTTHAMWQPQLEAFKQHFRLVRFDRRGHGGSGVPKGPYTMEGLARDALAVLDGLGLKKVNWCGLSMGGMEGMWLGANAPERFERMVLCNTSAQFPDRKIWDDRLRFARQNGLAAMVGANMERWFTKGFREREPKTIAWISDMFLTTPLEGYIGCGEAVRDMDHRALLPNIKVPTLVIAGRHDPATTLQAGEYLRDHIPGVAFTVLEAAHISNVEQPAAFSNAVLEFLLQRD